MAHRQSNLLVHLMYNLSVTYRVSFYHLLK
jgi:hypothetical protein